MSVPLHWLQELVPLVRMGADDIGTNVSLGFLSCTKWCIGNRPSSQLIVLLNAGSNFPFDFFFFVCCFFCHFASVYLFVEFDRRWRRKSNERCVECARLGRLVLTAFFDHVHRHGDSRSKKSINRYSFIKFDNSGGSGFEKSISWWCRTLFFCGFSTVLADLNRARVGWIFSTASPLKLSACSTSLFFFSRKEEHERWREADICEKRERGTKASKRRNKRKTECDNKTTSVTKGVVTTFQRNSDRIPWKQK